MRSRGGSGSREMIPWATQMLPEWDQRESDAFRVYSKILMQVISFGIINQFEISEEKKTNRAIVCSSHRFHRLSPAKIKYSKTWF